MSAEDLRRLAREADGWRDAAAAGDVRNAKLARDKHAWQWYYVLCLGVICKMPPEIAEPILEAIAAAIAEHSVPPRATRRLKVAA